ncbi:TniB family NTP-binding protein [Nocardia salmonicida]|uniref:TniB family NTP-binding protein n=1 Tax=Nocardia salmonicida TaxID=53431 RepID=UPI0013F4E2C8|nr:TniB family NTP-binding protein [Nocardia salmonicida]
MVLQTRREWSRIPRTVTAIEPPSALDGDPKALATWIYGLGPIETSDIRQLEQGMWELLQANGSAPSGEREWLGIDGPSLAGKTYAAVVAMLRIHDRLIQSAPKREHGGIAECIPVIYVADQRAQYLSLLKAIARFADLPVARNVHADDLLDQLRNVLPRLGTRLIVVDDAHKLRRVGAARDLTDCLKTVVDALPVTFVFIGAGLRQSALLKRTDRSEDEYSAAHQLELRAEYIGLGAFDETDDDQLRVWRGRIHQMICQFERIDGFDGTAARSKDFAANLFHFAEGLTGRSYKLLRKSTLAAVKDNRSPTTDDLIAVYRRGLSR